MQNAFIEGGWGMYPTLVVGLALIATCLQYARRPESRYVPLMLSLGLVTLMSGALGFFSGIISLLRYYTGAGSDMATSVLFVGFYESLHNVAFALMLATLGALLTSVGAWRLSRGAVALSSRTTVG
ncbi:hypothetical protein [Pyxidicoccus trucidator]|uniref:hypothetical protein n=1 Tax=Pyxidicoccus trucidator TaxID=2709662 RepID=UPI0013DA90F7|nr:hypothetical protein [Pyxidicoccus trucidator]